MADIDLPVWSIPPNWSTPVSERLAWLTDVMPSRSGTEQRRAVRLSPRREFEFKVNPVGRVRSYFDQWLHRISDERCLLPIWHDKSKLTIGSALAATRLSLSTAYTEFAAGSLAVVWADAFTYEVVSIASMDANGLNLTAPLASAWAQGAIVYPLRRAYLDPDVRLMAMTARVGDATIGFQIDDANDYPPGAETLTLYEDRPLILLEPNRRDDLETQFNRAMEEIDGQVGRIRRFDEVGRAFQTQFYNWQARGRKQHHELRQTLYRLNGRQKSFWMPSFNEDVVLARPLVAGNDRLNIEMIGYRALGGPIAGRDRIVIRDDTGVSHVVTVTGTSAALGPGEDRLHIGAPAGFNAPTGRQGAFLSPMRLDSDNVEIVHHTDSMGMCEVGVACRSFADTRNPTAPFIQERPEAEMNSVPCGDQRAVYDGWDYEISVRRTWTKHDPGIGLYVWPAPGGNGGNATGGAIGDDFDDLFGPDSEYNQGNQWWGARRVNMGDPGGVNLGTGVGNWNATLDLGIVNFFGTSPELLNSVDIFLYARHWTEEYPGTMVWSTVALQDNGDHNPAFPITIDWREYR